MVSKVNKKDLQQVLRNVDTVIDNHACAKKLGVSVDELLTTIYEEIQLPFSKAMKKNAFKIPFFDKEETEEFFSSELIDLGFLCMNKMKEIKEMTDQKIKAKTGKMGILAHDSMYNNWLMNRGY